MSEIKPRTVPDISSNAEIILEKRYYQQDETCAAQLFSRAADCVARGESTDELKAKWFAVFYEMMAQLYFLPNTPTLMNAGTPGGQLSACFVLPIDDTMESIFDMLKATAMIHKSGGGTGFNFSRLRPKNASVHSTRGVASGPVSFMRIYDAAAQEVRQGGKRRGANMGLLNVNHPDIMDFIACKENDGDFTNFNISVGITNEFMSAVDSDGLFALTEPRTGHVVQQIPARVIWNKIIERAWKNGDPGLFFLDTVNAANPTPHLGHLDAVNPCGEQPLLAGFDKDTGEPFAEACNLGSINLARMVETQHFSSGTLRAPRAWSNNGVNKHLLRDTVWSAVRFLDNVISVNTYPLPMVDRAVKRTRKIGLGVMGFADMLAQMGIPYDSEAGRQLAKDVMKFINDTALEASKALANERGTYPGIAPGDVEVRNATRTTIAPTGSLSSLANCWGGIEPYFSLVYEKHIMDGTVLREVNQYLRTHLSKIMSEEQMNQVIKKLQEGTTLRDISEVPQDLKEIYKTAAEISPAAHLCMQQAFQAHTDNAVSKTINLPNSATQEDIAEIYRMAHRLGLKGITVYRDGCKSAQVYYSPKKVEEPKEGYMSKEAQQAYSDNLQKLSKPTGVNINEQKPQKQKTPDVVHGTRIRKKTGCGQLYVHINRNEQGAPIEIFADLGKAGGCPSAFTEGLGRLASLALKHGATLQEVRDELIEIQCSRTCGLGPNYIGSCLDGTAKAIHDCLSLREGSPGISSGSESVTALSGPLSSMGSGKDGKGATVSQSTGPQSEDQAESVKPTFFKDVRWMNGQPGPALKPQSGACPSCGGMLDFVEGCRGGKCRNPACSYYTCG